MSVNRIQFYALSDMGFVRQNNEDNWGKLSDDSFYVLADGMGGHKAGEVASEEAVTSLLYFVEEALSMPINGSVRENIEDLLRFAMQQTNWLVFQKSLEDEKYSGMGTTLCCTFFCEGRYAVYAHVGDSRIYRQREGVLEQLTEDHSLFRELVNIGELTEEEEANYVFKNVLTKAIGLSPRVQSSIGFTELAAGDIFIMCTDGLTDLVRREEIQEIVNRQGTMESISHALVNAAKEYGGTDNVTVVLMKVEE